jgi:hypothetical protein
MTQEEEVVAVETVYCQVLGWFGHGTEVVAAVAMPVCSNLVEVEVGVVLKSYLDLSQPLETVHLQQVVEELAQVLLNHSQVEMLMVENHTVRIPATVVEMRCLSLVLVTCCRIGMT